MTGSLPLSESPVCLPLPQESSNWPGPISSSGWADLAERACLARPIPVSQVHCSGCLNSWVTPVQLDACTAVSMPSYVRQVFYGLLSVYANVCVCVYVCAPDYLCAVYVYCSCFSFVIFVCLCKDIRLHQIIEFHLKALKYFSNTTWTLNMRAVQVSRSLHVSTFKQISYTFHKKRNWNALLYTGLDLAL